jgi:hypothetical protein
MATLGTDCDIMLSHPNVNAGVPLGFLLYRKPTELLGPPVKVHLESYTNALGGTDSVRHLWFNVLLADGLLNPDGSLHADSAATMRSNLLSILMEYTDINLYTPAGLIAGLAATGHVMIHTIYPQMEVAEIQLSNDAVNFAPVDPARYAASAWVDLDTYTGVMTWSNSYWRT